MLPAAGHGKDLALLVKGVEGLDYVGEGFHGSRHIVAPEDFLVPCGAKFALLFCDMCRHLKAFGKRKAYGRYASLYRGLGEALFLKGVHHGAHDKVARVAQGAVEVENV